MRSTVADLWLQIRASYWFIPSLMAAAAIALSFVVVYIDERVGGEWLTEAGWLFVNQPAGARALLSTVAGSMITVAGVTFSMTLLAVSHASAQIGPRLLTAFMRDRGNQFTLGTFIATFLYCLMVLRTVHAGSGDGSSSPDVFVPHIAIIVAVALAILSVLVLIYYIHHIPQSISIANVVQRVGDDLEDGIRHLYPQGIGNAPQAGDAGPGAPGTAPSSDSVVLGLRDDSGYLRILDTTTLLELTVENDIVVEILLRPGRFAVHGQPVLRAWPRSRIDEELEKALLRTFSWGAERYRKQDVLYPAEQLLEIVGKAMSPAVNSQYTAVLCLNQFERAIVAFLRRDIPSAQRHDDAGRLRIIAAPVSHADFLDEIFAPLRQFLRADWITNRHLLQSIDKLLALPELAAHAALLQKHRGLLCEEIESGQMCETEKRLLL